jgi:isoquinoline 1-oxidoreductase beta subunit
METMIDEIAQSVGKDAVAYRNQLLGERHKRHRAALNLAVERSGYGIRSLPTGHAWGVAAHESFDSIVAYVVEASLEEGRPRVHRITAAIHCNIAVNPLNVEAQIHGAALMALGTTLPNAAITLKNGIVEQSNFHDYTVLRNSNIPLIDVHIVPSTAAPTGVGEPGLPPLAPALANALSRLGVKPIRQLPFPVSIS